MFKRAERGDRITEADKKKVGKRHRNGKETT
jgi:hypothetical protein